MNKLILSAVLLCAVIFMLTACEMPGQTQSVPMKINPSFTIKAADGDGIISSNEVSTVTYKKAPANNGWQVIFMFTEEGANKFADYTAAHIGETVSICIDNTVILSPTIVSKISDGRVAVSISEESEAKHLVELICSQNNELPLSSSPSNS